MMSKKTKQDDTDTLIYRNMSICQREQIIKQNKKIILQNDYATLIAVLFVGYITILANKRGR